MKRPYYEQNKLKKIKPDPEFILFTQKKYNLDFQTHLPQLNFLPTEIIYKICKNLMSKELFNFSLTNSRNYEIVANFINHCVKYP